MRLNSSHAVAAYRMDARVFNRPGFLQHELLQGLCSVRSHNLVKYLPSTVRCKLDITSNGRSVVTCLFDMKTREMIGTDTMVSHGKYKDAC